MGSVDREARSRGCSELSREKAIRQDRAELESVSRSVQSPASWEHLQREAETQCLPENSGFQTGGNDFLVGDEINQQVNISIPKPESE